MSERIYYIFITLVQFAFFLSCIISDINCIKIRLAAKIKFVYYKHPYTWKDETGHYTSNGVALMLGHMKIDISRIFSRYCLTLSVNCCVGTT